jgi:hypothetical protein
MAKKLLIAGAVILAGAGIYLSGIYTYFQKVQVQEALPTPSGTAVLEVKREMQGNFVNVDAIHQGSGTAAVLEVDGKRYLRFENFQVTNGPDLYVYLAQGMNPSNDTASLGTYVDLGRLKGNVGDQNYELPEGTGGFNTAVIWCKKFGVLFSYAVMK